MNKKLITLAVAGALVAPLAAQADSANVSISGFVSAGVERYTSTGKSTELLVSDGKGSRIIFKGEEDLGGGLKAHFTLDNRVMVDQGNSNTTGTAFAGGNMGVGLKSSDLGTLTLGRWDLHYNEGATAEVADLTGNQAQPTPHTAWASMLTTLDVNPAAAITTAIISSRFNNVVMYNTPVWGGFYGKVAYSTNPRGNEGTGTGNGSKGAAINVVAGYTGGPIIAGVSYLKQDIEGEDTAFNATTNFGAEGLRAWFSYAFPFGLKVGVLFDKAEYDTSATATADRDALAIPVSYTFGNHVVHAAYAKADDLNMSGTGTVDQSGATFWSVGYDYKLSKRTSVGASYATISNDTNAVYNFFKAGGGSYTGSVIAAGEDAKSFYVGVNHLF